MKILIIKLNKIGDVLLTSPMFANLKAHFGEDCTIDLAVNFGTEGLVDSTLLRNIYCLKRPKKLFAKIKAELAFLSYITKESYDIVFGLTYGERTAFLSLLSRAKTRVGMPPNSFWAKHIYNHKMPYTLKHNVEINLDALRLLKIPIISKCVRANIAKKSEKLENLPQKFIHCHFFSDWLFKCLSDKFCAKIIDTITQTYNIPCVLTTAPNPNELQKLQTIQSFTQTKPIIFAGNLALNEVALLNSKALAFVGVDTSIMHLSAANDIPAFAFFGPSWTFAWGAWDNSLYDCTYKQQQGGIQKMGKHCIYQESLPCVPCGKAGCNDTQKSDCLLHINEENALKTLHTFLTPLIK